MLSQLVINNVVLIDQLHLECKNHLTALTGETGAGKSILLDSLNLCLGMRAESRLIRKKAEKAKVTAVFSISPDHTAHEVLEEQDIESEGDIIILKRSINKEGRSKAFVNDQPVSLSTLKQIGNTLVEIHGQFETHGLLNPKTHRGLLDTYGGLRPLLQKVQAAKYEWYGAQQRLTQMQEELSSAKEEEEFFRASLKDLEDLDVQVGEEGTLTEKKNLLANKSNVIKALEEAHTLMSSDQGAQSSLGQAWRILEKISDKAGEELGTVIAALDNAYVEMNEAINHVTSYLTNIENDSESLESVDDRLHAIRGQARKFNCMADQLPEKCQEIREKLDNIETSDEVLKDLINQVKIGKETYINLAKELHDKRVKAAQKLDQQVNAELSPLKLEKAAFSTSITLREEERWSASGMDDVVFEVATNPGSPAGPLNKIASGGELSRFMLALKLVLADAQSPGTLIFDEIDAGVGGATASAIGERLATLGDSKQVLVITHSPQVAASAAHHWIVSKNTNEAGETTTKVKPLEGDDSRREEIGRMLAGSEITTEARAAAEKLLEKTGT